MSMSEKEVNELACALADKLGIDVLPKGLIETLQTNQSLRPYAGMVNATDYVELRLSKVPDNSALWLEWMYNGTVVARQRFGAVPLQDGGDS